MTPPYVALGNFKIAPFRLAKVKPYGSFINTTSAWEFPIKQSIELNQTSLHFNWLSAAHAFHAQKLIYILHQFPRRKSLQTLLIQSLRQLESTKNKTHEELYEQNDFLPLIEKLLTGYPEFIKKIESFSNAYKIKFMRDVLKLKLEQHPHLKKLAAECAQEGIIPIFVDHNDTVFSSGIDGLGHNSLGIMIYALGNQYLRAQNQQSLIQRVSESYAFLRAQNAQALSYKNLLPFIQMNTQGWVIQLSPGVESDKKEKITQVIQQHLLDKGCIAVRTVAHDMHNPQKIVTQFVFQYVEDARNFRNMSCAQDCQISADSKTISIPLDQLNTFLGNLGLKIPSFSHVDSWQDCLLYEHQQYTQYHDARIFKPTKVRDLVEDLIRLLVQSPLESHSLYQHALADYLLQLQDQLRIDAKLQHSALLLQKIKQFSDAYTATASYDVSLFYQQIHHALHDPNIKNLCDLRNKIIFALSQEETADKTVVKRG